jgi:glycerol-3-phosphate cytidylyltransferase
MSVIYCFDLDGTICSSVESSRYEEAVPDNIVVDEINKLVKSGNIVKIMTARGCVSGVDHTELTKNQLADWGVQYHELIMNMKPHAHIFIDDRAINVEDWKRQIPQTTGIIAGAFDLIHPGYITMFKQAKLKCNHLTVALHEDPTLENKKVQPVHSVKERIEILESIRYIDSVITYSTEAELYSLLCSGKFDIRFLGSDYIGKKFTGYDLDIVISWIDRSHEYSTTRLKRDIITKNGEVLEN